MTGYLLPFFAFAKDPDDLIPIHSNHPSNYYYCYC